MEFLPVAFLIVYIALGELTVNKLDVLRAPVIFFVFWVVSPEKYMDNKEEIKLVRRELLFWANCAIVSVILYIYMKKTAFILIAVYSLVFLIIGSGNRFNAEQNG